MAQKRKVYCKPFFLRSDVRKILEYLVRCKNRFGVLNPFLQRTKCNTSPFCKTKCCALPKSILASNSIFASGIVFLHHAIKHRN